MSYGQSLGLLGPNLASHHLRHEDGGNDEIALTGLTGLVTTFLGLTDTPSAYTGSGGKLVAIKGDVSGLEFVGRTLLGLTDFPANYTSAGGYTVKVNSGATALEFVNFVAVTTFLALSDTPSAYTGSGGKLVAIKGDVSGLEFVDRTAPFGLNTSYGAGATITLAGNAPVIIDDLTAAYTTVGLLLSNSTVATGASNRYAPTLRFQANSWNGASTPDYIDMTMRALDGAVPALYIHYSRNGAAEVDLAYFGWNVGFAVMRNVYLCSEATSYHTYFGNPGSTNIMRNEHEYNTGYMHYIQGWQINNVVAAGFINDGWTFPATATKGTITGNGAFAFDLRDTDTATAPDLYLFKFGWKSSVASCVPIWGWTDGDFYCNGDIYNAYKGDLSSTEELVVLNAVTLTSAKQFPTNSIIEGCAIYVTEAITGGATGFTVGITTDLNLFATVATVTLGTTNSGEADSYVKATGATGVTITFTGGTPDGVKGRIRVKLFWRKQTAPTS